MTHFFTINVTYICRRLVLGERTPICENTTFLFDPSCTGWNDALNVFCFPIRFRTISNHGVGIITCVSTVARSANKGD